MIIEMLLSCIYGIFSLLTAVINIPSMPDSVLVALDNALEYLQAGAGILVNYCELHYLLIMCGVLLAIDIGIGIYHFVMWVIKKIPMLGIS